jgi:hypothetical protein
MSTRRQRSWLSPSSSTLSSTPCGLALTPQHRHWCRSASADDRLGAVTGTVDPGAISLFLIIFMDAAFRAALSRSRRCNAAVPRCQYRG